ncbi:MAG TPA: 2-C-methyl-D-erythritol 4-phosphate cytidylyltransferase [Candidatus Paceibacterota bacterium]|nr:2-C-methyl-D-erythritol 4-phosphate cytidylyltransferase [Verrucomicrobiota bacterium]HRY48205.1 2-C-methyl-D-erythritol 4-phosphate cytidylyltransferase [Candidatus Paceibacterota bacterium]HSA01327.1 2-C-methyl-D-erythritol 4-phosphate cytidylyltransferase [Candidatus Paceibacterota bacterium]
MTSAILVAAGRGTRMGANVEKVFLEVAGQPLIAHTWRRFDLAVRIDEVILVVRPAAEDLFRQLASRFGFQKPYRFAPGGDQRQESVWNGLQAVSPETRLVAIHDGARPCVSDDLIAATLDAAAEIGAAVAAQRISDTIKESADGRFITRNVDRSRLWSVQTPQAFQIAIIRRALAEVRSRGLSVTDDTAACEFIGQPVKLVESRHPNPKATTPADLDYISLLLQKS